MENRKRRRILIAVLLLFSIGNFSRMAANSNIRTVEFLSVLAIGILTGLLIREFFEGAIKKNDKIVELENY